ncbi:nucleosome assembly protein 1-like 1 isoform X2 [Pomacea canaliculata]|uniref:nucleosome assembly protein 1-like 1 isoform X2 n=1 Tax=Pomacea canaliculata TaxID=400727 RepID=UPI000D72BFDD|nr:nucleosome assembly protein 1-like 1 isoform X2 [Pomacea canaliculata]
MAEPETKTPDVDKDVEEAEDGDGTKPLDDASLRTPFNLRIQIHVKSSDLQRIRRSSKQKIKVEFTREQTGDTSGESTKIAHQLMKNPQVLAALQDKLGSIVGTPSGYIQSLPKVVKRRLKAMKKLQNEGIKLESEFYREVHALECKYAAQYASLFDKRRDIVTGTVEPTEEECDWPSDDEKEEENKLADELKEKTALTEKSDEDKKKDEDVKGVPGFWLTIFKNVDMLAEMVQEHDEPILQHLRDIKVRFTESEPLGFILEFHFETNEYFQETVLTKQYTMRFEQDPADPFSYEGPEIIKCQGCPITWNKGKNVTVKVVKKKQKHKGRGTTRTVTKTVQNDSFFNFFNPPTVPEGENEDDMDEDLEALLAADFEIGHFIRERIVPRAVLYFTGEALENDEYDDEENEEEDEEGEYDEENDPDYQPTEGEKPAECKQQ